MAQHAASAALGLKEFRGEKPHCGTRKTREYGFFDHGPKLEHDETREEEIETQDDCTKIPREGLTDLLDRFGLRDLV